MSSHLPPEEPSYCTDETLAHALAQGDDTALDTLMLRWQLPLRSFLYRYTHNEADAHDLAQETFVRLYQKRRNYRLGHRYSTWMFQIALNLARDHARRQKRRPTLPFEDNTEPSTDSNPQTHAQANEAITELQNALASLPLDLRETLLLSSYQELSHQEIAELQHTTPKAIESRIYRARQHLRDKLQRWL